MHFPLEQIHIVHGEKLIESPWTEINKAEAFLNIASEISENTFLFNESKRFYCARNVLPGRQSSCLGDTKGVPKPPIADGTMERLSDFFKPHTRMFYDLVNRELGWPASDK